MKRLKANFEEILIKQGFVKDRFGNYTKEVMQDGKVTHYRMKIKDRVCRKEVRMDERFSDGLYHWIRLESYLLPLNRKAA